MTQTANATTHRWVGRPWAARTVRVLVYLVPFVASVAVAFLLGSVLPAAPTKLWTVARFLGIALTSTVALILVDRLTRRLLPLAALLDLTLLFPDQAPSRYKVALRSGSSSTQLQKMLDEYHSTGADEPARAAERLLELVGALRDHDRLTRGHSERVRAYSQMIGEEMGMSGVELDRLRWAGLVHDIGKLRIDPAILNKPDKLTDDEYEVIKQHPEFGAELARPLAAWLGESVLAVSQHHERWDGRGYPYGLAGHDIALPARIVSVADTFDVMTSVRSYKSARSAAEARRRAGAVCRFAVRSRRRPRVPQPVVGQAARGDGTAVVDGPAGDVPQDVADDRGGAGRQRGGRVHRDGRGHGRCRRIGRRTA